MASNIDLITALASSIAYSEGGRAWFDKSNPSELPVRNHNPGDLRAEPADPTSKIVNNFAINIDDAHGIADMIHQICLDIARGYTFRKLMSDWAPASDNNNAVVYFTENLRRLKSVGLDIDPDKPLLYYLKLVEIP